MQKAVLTIIFSSYAASSFWGFLYTSLQQRKFKGPQTTKYCWKKLVDSHPNLAFLQCARQPELLEYPNALLRTKFWNPPDRDLDEVGQGGVPKSVSKYGMRVLEQLSSSS